MANFVHRNTLLEIVQFLPPSEILAARAICKAWLEILETSQLLWRRLYLNFLFEGCMKTLRFPIEYNAYFIKRNFNKHILERDIYEDLHLRLEILQNTSRLNYREMVLQYIYIKYHLSSIICFKEIDIPSRESLPPRSGQAMHVVRNPLTGEDYLTQIGGQSRSFQASCSVDLINLTNPSIEWSNVHLGSPKLPYGWYYCSVQLGNTIYLFGRNFLNPGDPAFADSDHSDDDDTSTWRHQNEIHLEENESAEHSQSNSPPPEASATASQHLIS